MMTSPPSFVESPVHVFLDDVSLSFCTLDFHPTDAFDSSLAIEFTIEVLREDEVFP